MKRDRIAARSSALQKATEVLDVLRAELRSRADAIFLIGVSGGPDSLALLHALCALRAERNLTLFAAHLDHGLRPGSAVEGEFVAARAREWGAEPVLLRADVPALARERRISLEEAGRLARYDALGAAAVERDCSLVAVAHTADDQVETVLMNLLRGTGLAGLAGMPECRPLFGFEGGPLLVRPLLGVWRGEILAYCCHHGLAPLSDPSNRSRRFTRNRIRLDLLPLLESRFNPQVRRHLLDLAETVRAGEALRRELAAELMRDAQLEAVPGRLALDLAALGSAPPSLAIDALRAAFAHAAGSPLTLDRRATGRLQRLMVSRGPRRADLVAGWEAEREGATLVLRRGEPEPAPLLGAVPLPVPGRVEIPQLGIRLAAELVPAPRPISARRDVVHLDPASISGALAVRAPWPGARFRPLGMRGRKKLSDFFIDRKVARSLREHCPVVVDEEKIVWIAGLEIDDRVRLAPGARTALRLSLL